MRRPKGNTLRILRWVRWALSTVISAPARSTPSVSHSTPITRSPSRLPNMLGVLSLIFWSLIIVISVKYLVFVMRADNHGEGGILALTALIGAKSRVMLPGTQR